MDGFACGVWCFSKFYSKTRFSLSSEVFQVIDFLGWKIYVDVQRNHVFEDFQPWHFSKNSFQFNGLEMLKKVTKI